MRRFFTTLCLLTGLLAAAHSQPIDRRTVVERHNPHISESLKHSPAQVGNGRFAFGVDVTGLQTFRAFNTLSDWGWHSFPLPEGCQISDYQAQVIESYGKKIPYILRDPLHPEISDYLRCNPHRINLGRIGFMLIKRDASPATEADIADSFQESELWTGLVKSRFSLEGSEVSVRTACHPGMDMVSVRVSSDLISQERLGFFIELPYAKAEGMEKFVGDYDSPALHSSSIAEEGDSSAKIVHTLDDTSYEIVLEWQGDASIVKAGEHRYELRTKGGDSFDLTVLFRPVSIPGGTPAFLANFDSTGPEAPLPVASDIEKASAAAWEEYWTSGAAVDLSGSSDPRWKELERRIVLSQYLMRINETGLFPPQESGLVNNGWYGRYHWEMIWWHAACFQLWGRQKYIDGYLATYKSFLPEARERAASEGRKGAKWPKCTANFNREWPCEPHAMLIWQQPHPIWFAEQEYRANPSRQTLDKWTEIVVASADYMADYPFWDKEGKRFVLGPPVIPVSENTKMEETMNPVFELSYWRYGLRIAIKWASRTRVPGRKVRHWKSVLEKLSALPVEDGCYITHERMEDMWGRYNFEHPALTGMYGWLPGDGVDKETFRRTFYKVLDSWQMDRIWGWDYPMLAMAAARLGDPAKAVDLLCTTAHKFAFDEHGLADMWPSPYFPASGGLLTAVAMMCQGWDGLPAAGFEASAGHAPGFPADGSWIVRYEGFHTMQ